MERCKSTDSVYGEYTGPRQFVAVRVNAGRWDLYQCSKRSIKARLIGSYPALTPIREYLGADAIASSIVADQIVYQANR